MIHTGPYADELARSMYALAVTMGTDIYFRNGAYKPETEDGRRILAHELTHISQYEEGRTGENFNREELEAEAERAEGEAGYEEDPYIRVKGKRKIYRIKRSEIKKVIKETARGIQEWVMGQKDTMPEEQYLGLLTRYAKWIGVK